MTYKSLLDFICKINKNEDKIAIEENVDGVFVKHSYKELVDDACLIASYIKGKGLFRENIAIIGENSYKWLVSYFGIILSDNVAVLGSKDAETEDIVKIALALKVKIGFVSSSVSAFFDNILIRNRIVCYDDEITVKKLYSLEELIKNRENCDDEVACIVLTSGTSGYNKAAQLTHKNICYNLDSVVKFKIIDHPGEGYAVNILPFYHTYELFCHALPCLMFSMTLVIDTNIRNYIKNLIAYKPETHIVVPSLLDFINKKTDLFGDQRFKLVVGGAAVDTKVYNEMLNKGFKVLTGYGMTEASPLIAAKTIVDDDPLASDMLFTNVKINEPDENGEGEILVKGDNITPGYYNDKLANKESFTSDGWFKTGDVGYLKNDRLYFTGRIKNTIILSNGKNVQPEKIEEMVYEKIPYINDIVVCEMTLNNKPCVGAVIYSGEYNLLDNHERVIEDIREFNKLLEPHQRIVNIAISSTVLPKNQILKIIRKNVKKQISTYKSYSIQ